MDTANLQALGGLLAEKGLLTHTTNLPDDTLPICGADCDSRVVEPGHLFICKGAAFRPAYLASALERGAVAYLADAGLAHELTACAPDVPALVTPDIRSAMALVSAAAWGHPDRRMQVAGITGTKGKTTVAAFVRAILDGKTPGSHAAIIGTLETYDGQERFVSKNTTPEAPDLWRHLAHAADHGLACVMEVSSQGLKYQRTEGLTLGVAAFLNIGVDHVSAIEHPTFEDYLASKLKIFEQARVAVVGADIDEEHRDRIMGAARTCGRLVTFGLDHVADFTASDIRTEDAGLSFDLIAPTWSRHAHLSLTGRFNVENALAAAAIATELGSTPDEIVSGLASCRVPGRMDVCASADGRLTAIVDYAHNGMAVRTVMETVRASYPDRYVVCVFGATGGKGAERRFEMPGAAAPFADHLVFTEDDAGPERPEDICAQMMAVTPDGTSAEVVLDRQDAILHALDLARASGRKAVVCVLGKGHEARQLRSDGAYPMVPDGQFVREHLA